MPVGEGIEADAAGEVGRREDLPPERCHPRGQEALELDPELDAAKVLQIKLRSAASRNSTPKPIDSRTQQATSLTAAGEGVTPSRPHFSPSSFI